MSSFFDKDQFANIQEQLQKLGLTQHQSSVYIALLNLGQVGSSKIIQMTGLHGQYVYQALYDLEEKGLVGHIIYNGRKRFQAKHPQVLNQIAEAQKDIASNVVTQINGFLSLPPPQQFDIYQGEDSYVRYEFQSLMAAEKGILLCIIGGDGDLFMKIMGARLPEYERIRVRKEIQIRYLGSISQKSELTLMKKEREFFESRVLPGLFTGLVNTNIWQNHIGLNLFGNPILCFTISNTQVADSYRGFFNTLWELGTKT